MRPPCGDALEMRVVNIARPPVQVPCATRKFRYMLACSAAQLEYVSGFRQQEGGNSRPDRFMVAVKGWAVQPAVLSGRLVLDDELDHGCDSRKATQKTQLGMAGGQGQRLFWSRP